MATSDNGRVVNALTVDVEDYFQVSAFEQVVARERWDVFERRVVANTDRLLTIFAERGVRATFFVLGWVAEREPALVRRIAAAGHEIGSHGYSHRLVYDQTPDQFRDDVRRAKAALQAVSGQPVMGYRAPSFSVTERSLWALDILAEEGFVYDASIFPVRHDRYGIPSAPRHPYRVNGNLTGSHQPGRRGGTAAERGQTGRGTPVERSETPPWTAVEQAETTAWTAVEQGFSPALPRTWDPASAGFRESALSGLVEIPASTIRIAGVNLPVAGGGYFRLLPYWWTRWGIARLNELEGKPAVFYLHPWEVDPEQPRLDASRLSRFRHYRNLATTEVRLKRLLQDFEFAPVADAIMATALAAA